MFTGCTSLRGAIEYDASKTDGTYANYTTGYFTQSKYYTIGKNYYRIADDLTVESLPLEDGSNFSTPEAFTAKTASYKRAMSNTWATLCLPYAFTAPTADAYIYKIKSQDESQLVVTRVDGTIEAGTPVLVCKKSDANAIEINATDAAVVAEPAGTTDGLVGTFTETTVPDNGYIIANNKFWLASDLKSADKGNGNDVRTKAFRAYVDGTAVHSAPSMLTISTSGEATAISALNAAADGTAECYDLQGRRLNGLQKGVNIVKTGNTTKKIIIE